MKITVLNESIQQYKEPFLELMGYCFNPEGRPYFESEFDALTKDKATILGIIDNETLGSTVSIINKDMMLNGAVVKMGGIACVASSPYYRSSGMVSALMKESLKVMAEHDIVFSLLAPFKYEFYEKFDYKLCVESLETKLAMSDLKSFKNVGIFKEIKETNLSDLFDFYHEAIASSNGPCRRDAYDFQKKFDPTGHGRGVAFYNDEHQMEGYMLYKIAPGESQFTVHELVFTTPRAIQSLFHFIYLHEAQAKHVVIWNFPKDLLMHRLQTPRAEWKLHAGMMGRIVKVEPVLQQYRFIGNGHLIMKVNDELCEWNNQTFELTIQDGTIQSLVSSSATPQIEIHIKELSQLVMGYRTMLDLVQLGTVKVSDQSALAYFQTTSAKVALYDFF